MTRSELIGVRSRLRDLLEELTDESPEEMIDIADLPTGSRLLMLDAAEFAEQIEYRLARAVHDLADRDGV